MRSLVRLPLYLGMAVLTLSILFSAYQLSHKEATTPTASLATQVKANLGLIPDKGDFVIGQRVDLAITVTSSSEIGGADIVLHFDPESVKILTSDITGGNLFSLANINSDKISSGEVTVAWAAKNKNGEKNAILGTIKLLGIKKGESIISVDRQSKVYDASARQLEVENYPQASLNFR